MPPLLLDRFPMAAWIIDTQVLEAMVRGTKKSLSIQMNETFASWEARAMAWWREVVGKGLLPVVDDGT